MQGREKQVGINGLVCLVWKKDMIRFTTEDDRQTFESFYIVRAKRLLSIVDSVHCVFVWCRYGNLVPQYFKQKHSGSITEGVTPPPSAAGTPVNYGPVSRIPLNFKLESRILIDKKV